MLVFFLKCRVLKKSGQSILCKLMIYNVLSRCLEGLKNVKPNLTL